jgi:hypothetical protein
MPKDHALSPAICIETKKVGALRYIDSVSSAAEALLIEWPEQGKGREWRVAMTMIHACLAGKCKPDKARAAFLKAAKVAGIFVREGDHRGR